MLRHFSGWVGWGLLTFTLTCVICTCYVTSWVIWVGWGGGVLTFRLTCVTCTCYVTSWISPCGHHNCRIRADVVTDVTRPCNLLTLSFMLRFVFQTTRVPCFIKSAMPCSLATRVNSHVNPKLMRNIRVWQWHWINSKSKSLFEVTGRSVTKRMVMWEEENIARVFKSKFPVNYRTSWKMHFKSLGNLKPSLWNESLVLL